VLGLLETDLFEFSRKIFVPHAAGLFLPVVVSFDFEDVLVVLPGYDFKSPRNLHIHVAFCFRLCVGKDEVDLLYFPLVG
jgi:hypothetical protein